MKQITFSTDERNLIVELLEAERSELPAEIHHTDSARVHDDLKLREELVKSLLRRLAGEAECVSASPASKPRGQCSCS